MINILDLPIEIVTEIVKTLASGGISQSCSFIEVLIILTIKRQYPKQAKHEIYDK